MQKRVVEAVAGECVSYRGKRITISLEWICKLECGHTESRVRPTSPDRLKCSSCAL